MAMSSLVGYGVSSDSEEEEDSRTDTAEKKNIANAEGEKTRNFLMESGSDPGESSSESEPEQTTEPPLPTTPPPPPAESRLSPSSGSGTPKLPPPSLERSGPCSSVFTNPFKEKAEEKLSALQKHVPLTLQPRPNHIAGKKICTAYRRDGRCRFGSRCKFAHDSDLQSRAGLRTQPEPEPEPAPEGAELNNATQPGPECRISAADEEESRKRRKHRVGINDTLVPPKRALKQYATQKFSQKFSD